MRKPILHVASEISEGIEKLWVTSDSTTVLLTIDVQKGVLRSFSCRLGPGVVVEMGEDRSIRSEQVYPSLCIFTEGDDRPASPMQFVRKIGADWLIEDQEETGA